MKKIIALSLLTVCLMAAPAGAVPTNPGDTPPAAQVLSDAQMAEVVGGQINVPPTDPGLGNPTPPVGQYIKDVRNILGINPGHFSAALGAHFGFASFVRANNPYTDARGLANILFQR